MIHMWIDDMQNPCNWPHLTFKDPCPTVFPDISRRRFESHQSLGIISISFCRAPFRKNAFTNGYFLKKHFYLHLCLAAYSGIRAETSLEWGPLHTNMNSVLAMFYFPST